MATNSEQVKFSELTSQEKDDAIEALLDHLQLEIRVSSTPDYSTVSLVKVIKEKK